MISPYYLPRRCAPLEIILLKSYFYLLPRSIEREIILLFLNPSVTNYTLLAHDLLSLKIDFLECITGG